MSDTVRAKFEELKKTGRGAIIISAHTANWELFPCGVSAHGYPVSVIAKKMSNPVSQNLIEQRRETAGFNVIYTGGTIEKMKASLTRGELIGFMVDQHMPGKKGLETLFFNTPAKSIRGLAGLARETNCCILPVCIFKDPDGYHYLEMLDELEYISVQDLGENSPERLAKEELLNTQLYQDSIEKLIRMHPEQWLWMHSRWKVRRRPTTNQYTAD